MPSRDVHRLVYSLVGSVHSVVAATPYSGRVGAEAAGRASIQNIASNAMTRIQTISCFPVREPGAALSLSLLAIHFECVQTLVFWLSMPIKFLLTTIFFREIKSLPPISTIGYESEPNLPEAETASSKRRLVQRPLPFYRKDAQPAEKYQVNNVPPPRRLIALLTTEIVARIK